MNRVLLISIVTTSGLVLAMGCNAILGNTEGTLDVSEAGSGVDAALDTGAPGDAGSDVVVSEGGYDAALDCPGRKACAAFSACVDKTDVNFGCGDTDCQACNTDHAKDVTCVAGDGGNIVCKPTCDVDFRNCDGDPSNGCETNVTTAAHCGSCNGACNGAAALCTKIDGGAYGCAASCGGATPTLCGTECADTQTDVNHCGTCPTVCPADPGAKPTCDAGTCGFVCKALYHLCNGKCVVDGFPGACGPQCTNCNKAAPPNMVASCQNGGCQFSCAAGFMDCNQKVDDGCEIDVRNDSTNCGGCKNDCNALALPFDQLPGPLPLSRTCCNGTCIPATTVCALPPG